MTLHSTYGIAATTKHDVTEWTITFEATPAGSVLVARARTGYRGRLVVRVSGIEIADADPRRPKVRTGVAPRLSLHAENVTYPPDAVRALRVLWSALEADVVRLVPSDSGRRHRATRTRHRSTSVVRRNCATVRVEGDRR